MIDNARPDNYVLLIITKLSPTCTQGEDDAADAQDDDSEEDVADEEEEADEDDEGEDNADDDGEDNDEEGEENDEDDDSEVEVGCNVLIYGPHILSPTHSCLFLFLDL
jgi:hypothetical protein